MNLREFLDTHRAGWQEFDGLLAKAEHSEVDILTPAQARRLVDLYRRASADLLQARALGAGVDLTDSLEALVARGYGMLYRPSPLGGARALGRFFRDTFPRTLRREARAMGIAAAAFATGILLGGVATMLDPEASRLFVPADHQALRPSERVRRDEARQAERGAATPSEHAAFSSFLFTHNIRVSVLAFAVGIAWGVPTLLFLAWHGVFLAALAVEYIRDGEGIFFFAWILPHGVVELTCMLVAGTAGLLLGRGALWPRGSTRGERIRLEARGALILLGGTAALLVVAGLIEGTVSQIHEPTLPYGVKIGMALALGALLHAYLWFLPLPHQIDPLALSER